MRDILKTSLLGLLFIIGCSDDDASLDDDDGSSTGGLPESCSVGQTEMCTCPDGSSSMRTCISPGEYGACECDPGTTTSTTTDPTDGTSTGDLCGNGMIDDGEQCDDGNDDNDDDCSNDCVEHCGLQWSTLVMGQGNVSLNVDSEGIITSLSFDPQTVQAFLTRFGSEEGSVVENMMFSDPPTEFATGTSHLTDTSAHIFGFYSLDQSPASPRTSKLELSDGSAAWDTALPTELDFDGRSVTTTPDGDVVAVAGIDVAMGDTDVWVGKYDGESGAELWTSTHTGPTDGGFSLDQGGPVAIAENGDIYAVGRLRKSFNRNDSTLLRFDTDGGAAAWEDIVVVDTGTNHDQAPTGVAAGPDGAVAAAVTIFRSGASAFEVVRYDGEDRVFTVTDEMVGIGPFPEAKRVAFGGDGSLFIAGDYLADEDTGAVSVFVAHYDAQGTQVCAETIDVPGTSNGLVLTPDRAVIAAEIPEGFYVASVRP